MPSLSDALPRELDFAADREASEARMNRAMLYLVAWLRRIESVQPEFLSVTNQLKALGLDRINEILSPIFLAAQQTDEQLSALYQQWLASDVLAELEQSVTAALAGLVIGETVQAHSARLDALAAIEASAFGRGLLVLASAAALRGAAELGDVATLNKATAAHFRSNTPDKLLSTDQVWDAADYVALADAATIAIDMGTFINAKVTLAGNRTLGGPSNLKRQSGVIEIKQDATGGRTLSYNSAWKFPGGVAPTLSTAANALDKLYYQVGSDGTIHAALVRDVR